MTKTVRTAGLDEDIQKENTRQREYLERSVTSLRRKLAKDVELAKAENIRIMQENVALIKVPALPGNGTWQRDVCRNGEEV